MRRNSPWWLSPLIWFVVTSCILSSIGSSASAIAWIIPAVAILLAAIGLMNRTTTMMGDAWAQHIPNPERAQRAQREQQDRDDLAALAQAKWAADRIPRAVANKAVLRAGNRLDTWELDLFDIGVLAYHGDKTPDICRMDAVSSDTTHIRPFVVINLPYAQGKGTINFTLYDGHGDKQYSTAKVYQLKEGPNFITPPTWLPLPDDRDAGRWSLRVSIGERALAAHEFDVNHKSDAATRKFIAEDGEIDPWLSKALTEQGNDSSGVSLDDLLAEQEPEVRTMENQLR